MMNSHVQLEMAAQDGKQIPEFSGAPILRMHWLGKPRDRNKRVVENLFKDLAVPTELIGHRCAARVSVICDTYDVKKDWHLEGFAVSLSPRESRFYGIQDKTLT
jgi:hypothetical protein